MRGQYNTVTARATSTCGQNVTNHGDGRLLDDKQPVPCSDQKLAARTIHRLPLDYLVRVTSRTAATSQVTNVTYMTVLP
jgi:hypothetical protein